MGEGGRLDVKPRFCKELADGEMATESVQLAWRRYSAYGVDVTSEPALMKQDVLPISASPIASAAVPNAVASKVRTTSTSLVQSDEKHSNDGRTSRG